MKIILAGCSPNKSTPALKFELNGSYSDVQKTKTKTANRSHFWLPKIRTLDETIEEGCKGGGCPRVLRGDINFGIFGIWPIGVNKEREIQWVS